MFALADCNNFFASCERVFRPDLNGRPVIVLSNNDGCAVARSNEAKALGIKMGDPFFKIRHIVERNNVAVFSSNFALYGDMSRRVQEVLRSFAPAVEQYSIDEAFLDLNGMHCEDFGVYAREVSRTCLRWPGIPVSVGVAPTKTLAKIASKLCKKYPALHGGCYMYKPSDVEKVLRNFPVEDVWGIGRRTFAKLSKMGIKTAWDYTRISETAVRKMFLQPGWYTWRELRGEPCVEFEDTIEPKQTICVSRSFASEITDLSLLAGQVANFTESAVSKLRAQGSLVREMLVFAMTNRFKETAPQTSACVCVPFPDATSDHRTIVLSAVEGCRRLFRPGFGYKKAGVVLSKLVAASGHTLSLFQDAAAAQKDSRLSEAIDTINGAYGPGYILFGVQGGGRVRNLREHQSPHYTTLWEDIPKVIVR